MPLLVPVQGAHADALYKLLTNSKVTETIAWDGPSSLVELKSNLEERELKIRNGELHQFTILKPGSHEPIGCIDIRPGPSSQEAEIGLWIGEPFQGQGIGTQAIREVATYGFTHLKVETIRAKIFVGNLASRRAFEKAGFTLKATLRKAIAKRGVELDEWLFEVTRESHRSPLEGLIDLSGSELHSVLLEVFSEKANSVSPARLLEAWTSDRFVRPCAISPRDFLTFDSAAFDSASDFEPIELSPVCPLATSAAVAPVSQKKILSTIRPLEVVSDSTNVMALECAVRRRKVLARDPKNAMIVRLCSSHRLVRVQKFSGPKMTAHFRVFAMCTAGRDTGNFEFEAQAMSEQIIVLHRLLTELGSRGFAITNIKVGLYGEDKYLTDRILAALHKSVPALKIELLGKRGNTYYPTASFVLKGSNRSGEEYALADGGFTDWTQKLVGSSKERLMISGIGTDRVLSDLR